MFSVLKRRLRQSASHSYQPPEPEPDKPLTGALQEDLIRLRQLSGNTGDLLIREIRVSGIPAAVVLCEGMFSLSTLTELVIDPLTRLNLPDPSPEDILCWMDQKAILAADQQSCHSCNELFLFIMSGFVVILLEGIPYGMALGVQGFACRSVGEPSSETNVRGSREGFVESLRVNMSLVRRRMKTPSLRMELMTLGERSRTAVCLVYRSDRADPELLRKLRQRLSRVKLDSVLESGYLQPFLESRPLSLFSGVGVTERPDTVCAKVAEGRAALLVDGTPFALVVPHLFAEHFQSMDDYANRPYYSTFIRCLKYLSFFAAILLPGLYVAMAVFHPELFPDALLFNVAASEEGTPFPLMLEAIIIHLLYEIMREAGLRLPRPVGHAVSIVGALVIGDAAVTAGLIGTPMVMVVALTAICSFVVPSLYEPVAVLRFLFILLGGTLGLFGIMTGLAAVGVNLCAVTGLGVPATAPASPFSLYSMRDIFLRWGWRQLGKEDLSVSELPGSDLAGGDGHGTDPH